MERNFLGSLRFPPAAVRSIKSSSESSVLNEPSIRTVHTTTLGPKHRATARNSSGEPRGAQPKMFQKPVKTVAEKKWHEQLFVNFRNNTPMLDTLTNKPAVYMLQLLESKKMGRVVTSRRPPPAQSCPGDRQEAGQGHPRVGTSPTKWPSVAASAGRGSGALSGASTGTGFRPTLPSPARRAPSLRRTSSPKGGRDNFVFQTWLHLFPGTGHVKKKKTGRNRTKPAGQTVFLLLHIT